MGTSSCAFTPLIITLDGVATLDHSRAGDTCLRWVRFPAGRVPPLMHVFDVSVVSTQVCSDFTCWLGRGLIRDLQLSNSASDSLPPNIRPNFPSGHF